MQLTLKLPDRFDLVAKNGPFLIRDPQSLLHSVFHALAHLREIRRSTVSTRPILPARPTRAAPVVLPQCGSPGDQKNSQKRQSHSPQHRELLSIYSPTTGRSVHRAALLLTHRFNGAPGSVGDGSIWNPVKKGKLFRSFLQK
jgi:hypothetical protein